MKMTTAMLSPAEIRSQLDMEYVMYRYGHLPEEISSSRLKYKSPFRPDNNPSFDVYSIRDKGESVYRYGDFAEGTGGGVIDLVMRLEGTTFNKALVKCKTLIEEAADESWESKTPITMHLNKEPIDPNIFDSVLTLPMVRASHRVVSELVLSKPVLEVETLQEFNVRIRDAESIAIPFPDRGGVSIRMVGGQKASYQDSTFGLYHHPDEVLGDPKDDRTIIICEGVSDTWSAWAVFGKELQVLGIPGEMRPERMVNAVKGRNVIFAFDGDMPGRTKALNLAMALTSEVESIAILPIPRDSDISDHRESTLRSLMEDRRVPTYNTSMLDVDGATVVQRPVNGVPKILSNWAPDVDSVIRTSSGRRVFVLRIRVASSGYYHRTVQLSPEDMATPKTLHDWASVNFRGGWWGNAPQTSQLSVLLESLATFSPVGEAEERPVLRDDGFVLPHISYGTDAVFLPGPNVKSVMDNFDSIRGDFSKLPDAGAAEVFETLINMHEPQVIDPILAWMAMAPLRSRYRQFPLLFVTGPAGSGKTTLVEVVLRTFLGVIGSSALTSTTPYAVAISVGATNCMPTWFDEYRPGGRAETLLTLQQLIRDAYTSTPSTRGGLGSDKSRVHALPTDSPIIISGEDMADEQSHRDRLIRVIVPREGKGQLPAPGSVTHLGDLYYKWLTTSPPHIGGAPIDNPPEVEHWHDDDMPERQRFNLGLLNSGWALLREFATDIGLELRDPDWSALVQLASGESLTGTTAELLFDIYDRMPFQGGVTMLEEDDEFVYVQPNRVIATIKQQRLDVPFTNIRALIVHLTQDLGGEDMGIINLNDRRSRCVRIQSSLLFGTEQ